MNVTPNRLFEKIGVLTVENDLLREEVERLSREVESLRDELESARAQENDD